LTMTVSSSSSAAAVTLESLKKVKEELKAGTVLGVSNISFGLPRRSVLNSAFLASALTMGLDAAIINPLDIEMLNAFYAGALLAGRDTSAKKYVAFFAPSQDGGGSEEQKQYHPLTGAVIHGDREHIVSLVEEHLERGVQPVEILDRFLIPGIEEVGDKYGRGEYFLPQLMLSADAMKQAFQRLKPELESGPRKAGETVVIATVKGDIHDIGKNIVSIMLGNHGFDVVDLGKNVPNEDIISAAAEHNAGVVCLSALMTTTMPRMEEMVQTVRREGLPYKMVVGGAAVTERYARDIGADGYGRDAVEAVSVVKRLTAGS